MKCPFCGNEHAQGTLYCPETGKKIPSGENLCPNCQYPLQPGWKNCPRCGLKLIEEAEEHTAIPQNQQEKKWGLWILGATLLLILGITIVKLTSPPKKVVEQTQVLSTPTVETVKNYSETKEVIKTPQPVIQNTQTQAKGRATPQPITVENADELEPIRRQEDKVIIQIAYSPDGNLLGVVTGIGLSIYDLKTERYMYTDLAQGMTSLAFSPNGQLLAIGSYADQGGTVKLFRVSDRKLLDTLDEFNDIVSSVAFSPDGNTLAAGSVDGTVKLWNFNNDHSTRTLLVFRQVLSVAFSPDGELLALGSRNDEIGLWGVSSGELERTFEGDSFYVIQAVFSPDGKLLATGAHDGTVKLWQVSTGELLQSLKGHSADIKSVAFSPDGSLLATGSRDETVKLWQVSNGKLIDTLKGHSDIVTTVAFSPDSTQLATGSWDSTVLWWGVKGN